VAAKLGKRFQKALKMACDLHQLDVRKGTDIPYVSHLLAVASLVLEDGGDEDEAIAALLHDAVEDHGGLRTLKLIRTEFGDWVAGIVKACSDSATADPKRKPPWCDRKKAYLLHLSQETRPEVLRVSAADKLHNARCILADYRRCGDSLWNLCVANC
jgi:(p)ppGpp synthase/HD superfamily hydrolase